MAEPFFENVPGGGEAYLLSHIIHDWAEEQCLTILGNCRRAMQSTSRLLIIEMVLPAGDTPHPGKLFDMMMLVGASLSLAGLAGCRRPVEEIVPYVNAPEEIVPGTSTWYRTTCRECPAGCGMSVRTAATYRYRFDAEEGRMRLIGLDAEKTGTIRQGVRALSAMWQTTVPWCAVIVRNSFGVAGAAHRKEHLTPVGDLDHLHLALLDHVCQ